MTKNLCMERSPRTGSRCKLQILLRDVDLQPARNGPDTAFHEVCYE